MKNYRIVKALNHNVVQAVDPKGEDCIVFGKGIGFNRKSDDVLDARTIEKVYSFRDTKNLSMYQKLVEICDERLVTAVEQAIADLETQFKVKPNENLHVALLDHLNFSLYRYHHGLNISNLFIDELEMMYGQEYRFATALLEEINRVMDVQLPQAEVGFITLHIHSALKQEKISRTNLYIQIIAQALDYLDKEHQLRYPKDSLEKIRLITHLKFALKRANEHKAIRNDLMPTIQQNYSASYAIAQDLGRFIDANFNIHFQEDELGYLAMHIHLIQTR